MKYVGESPQAWSPMPESSVADVWRQREMARKKCEKEPAGRKSAENKNRALAVLMN